METQEIRERKRKLNNLIYNMQPRYAFQEDFLIFKKFQNVSKYFRKFSNLIFFFFFLINRTMSTINELNQNDKAAAIDDQVDHNVDVKPRNLPQKLQQHQQQQRYDRNQQLHFTQV